MGPPIQLHVSRPRAPRPLVPSLAAPSPGLLLLSDVPDTTSPPPGSSSCLVAAQRGTGGKRKKALRPREACRRHSAGTGWAPWVTKQAPSLSQSLCLFLSVEWRRHARLGGCIREAPRGSWGARSDQTLLHTVARVPANHPGADGACCTGPHQAWPLHTHAVPSPALAQRAADHHLN